MSSVDVDIDEIVALLPAESVVLELAREIERARIEAGLSTEEMLEDLRQQRQRCYEDRYGDIDKKSPLCS